MVAAFPRIVRFFIVVVMLLTTLVLTGRTTRVVAQEGAVLMEDKFNDNDNDWELAGVNKDYVDFDIDDGVLAISIDREDKSSWTFVTPDKAFPNDVDVTVDVEAPDAGDAYWYAALMLRSDMRQDNDDKYTEYYHFEVTSKGEWGFAARFINADDKDKLEYKLLKSGKISKFDAEDKHTLAVSARGNEFEFVIDGKKVGTFEDDTINDNNDEKYIGVLAGTLEGSEDKVNVTFDNFVVQGTEEDSGSTDNSGALLQDNFEDNANKWAVAKTDQSSVAIDDNALVMKVFEGSKDGLLRWAGPNKTLPGDVDVTVNAALDEGDTTGTWYYGVGVRFYTENDDTARYYVLAITYNEEWVFADFDGKKLNPIERDKISDFDAGKSNKVNVVAAGDTFEFYLNGKKLGEVEADKLDKQDEYNMVLVAGTLDEDSSITVNFTDLLVLEP